jgi:hypothetical protein
MKPIEARPFAEAFRLTIHKIVPAITSGNKLAEAIGMNSAQLNGWKNNQLEMRPSEEKAKLYLERISAIFGSDKVTQPVTQLTTSPQGEVVKAVVKPTAAQETLYNLADRKLAVEKKIADAELLVSTLKADLKIIDEALSSLRKALDVKVVS